MGMARPTSLFSLHIAGLVAFKGHTLALNSCIVWCCNTGCVLQEYFPDRPSGVRRGYFERRVSVGGCHALFREMSSRTLGLRTFV